MTLNGKPWAYNYHAFAQNIARRMKGSDTPCLADAAKRIFRAGWGDMAALRRKFRFVVVDGVPHAWEVKVFPRQNDTQISKEEVLPSAAGEM